MHIRTLLALSLSASTLALAMPAVAQNAQTPPAADASAQPDPENTIVVTGTRAQNRTLAQSPVPVDVISSEALSTSGLGEVNKVLNNLVPSFNFPQPSITDGTDVIRPASLRGLAPDQTLVLVNGKRRHVTALININGSVGRGSAAVDLNTIPALAIDRIEVLRDGASSQYGSDAIAGVINIRTKQANHGGKLLVSYGKYVTNLGGTPQLNGLQTDANGQPFADPNDTRLLAANYSPNRHANDGDLWVYSANIGVPIGPGYFNITGEFRDRDNTNRAGYDARPNYNKLQNGQFDRRELTFNRLEYQYGDPETTDYNVFANAGMPIGAFELYVFGSFSRRNGLSAANYRQSFDTSRNRDFSVLTPGATPGTANYVPIYPDGFLPFIQSKLTDYSIAGGIKGDVGGWHTDLSLVQGYDRFDYRTENSVNVSYGPASPRSFDSGGLSFTQTTANLDVSHDFDVGFAKPLTFAFGAEYRHENFKIRPGETASYAAGPYFVPTQRLSPANCTAQGGNPQPDGTCTFPGRAAPLGAQGFPGFPASARTNASRHSYAGYAELDTDIVTGLTTTAAVRYEHFSDFGETWNGKFAARYEILPGLGIRGSISNGFRAPSLHQQFFTTTSTNFIGGVPVDISTLPVSSPVALALGSKPLKPEKSLNITAGVTANPLRGLTFTADYYHIKIRDRIVLSENLGAAGSGTGAVNLAVKAILDANGFTSVGAARFFINGLDTTTEGVDIVGTYRLNAGSLGNWSLSAAFNLNRSRIDKRINTLGPLAQIPGLVLFGRVEGIRFTDGQPKDKLVLSADGNIGDFGLTARTTRYGKVVSPGSVAPVADANSLTLYGPDDVFLQPKWITDFELRYTFKSHVTFAIGANNLFDVYPTHNPIGNHPAGVAGQYPVTNYFQPYSSFSPFGFNGRFLYGRFTAQF